MSIKDLRRLLNITSIQEVQELLTITPILKDLRQLLYMMSSQEVRTAPDDVESRSESSSLLFPSHEDFRNYSTMTNLRHFTIGQVVTLP